MAIGESLFHFWAHDFVRNNPLFAVLVILVMLMELVGYNTVMTNI
jgi:peptidoglycan/LPS O-acetylase OafA/YrhL